VARGKPTSNARRWRRARAVHAVLALALPGAVKVNERGRGEAAGKAGKKRERGGRRKRIRRGGEWGWHRQVATSAANQPTNGHLVGRADMKDDAAIGPASIESVFGGGPVIPRRWK
jgi:hypothetical protein